MRLSSAAFVALALALSLVGATEQSVTPVQKVIELLQALKGEITADGQAEASTYDSFACFCKDTTESKSSDITALGDSIDGLSADIEEKTAEQATKASELQERKAQHDEKTKALEKDKATCLKDGEVFGAMMADLTKAIDSLHGAIAELSTAALGTSEPEALLSIRGDVEKSLSFADALNLKIPETKREAVSTFLQQSPGASDDPLDTAYKYSYHSDGIITTLNDLKTQFSDRRTDAFAEYSKTDQVCTDTTLDINMFLDSNAFAIGQIETDIDTLKGLIAGSRGDLVNDEAQLKDDRLYLKELTERCKTRAKDWDQRSAVRAEELEAISGVLAVLENKVQSLDAAVNLRASLLSKARSMIVVPHVQLPVVKNSTVAISLLQQASASHVQGGSSMQARQKKLSLFLKDEGMRLSSLTLSNLALQVSEDPFTDVKVLIQKLIERLLAESTNEATKKGFCDTEQGKAYKDRDYRHADVMKLTAELKQLKVKQDELETEIDLLPTSIGTLTNALNETTILRAQESQENSDNIAKAKEGHKLITQAISLLIKFYKQAGDIDGAGSAGAYKGRQVAGQGVIGMLEVIKTDFDRTIRKTTAQEAAAHADFVDFDRVSRAGISGKEMQQELDQQDLQTIKNTITEKMTDLKTAQDLVDSALKVLEDLKPTCIDTAMSYVDRVGKREEEIAALKRALCILDENSIEPECGGPSGPIP